MVLWSGPRLVSSLSQDVPQDLIMASDCFLTSTAASSSFAQITSRGSQNQNTVLRSIPAVAGPRPHRLITCLFVFVLTNLTHRGRECNKFRNLLNIRIHQRATLGGLGVWPDPLNVNTRSGTRVTKFGKQSQECSEEIPGSGLAWVPIIQIRIDSKRRQGSLLNTNYAPNNEWPSFLSCQPLLQLWA